MPLTRVFVESTLPTARASSRRANLLLPRPAIIRYTGTTLLAMRAAVGGDLDRGVPPWIEVDTDRTRRLALASALIRSEHVAIVLLIVTIAGDPW